MRIFCTDFSFINSVIADISANSVLGLCNFSLHEMNPKTKIKTQKKYVFLKPL